MSNHPRQQDPPVAPPVSATVLLVDREALYRWFVAESLRGCGIEVVPCGSMEEATNILCDRSAPDLLVVDGEMLEKPDPAALSEMHAWAGAAPWLVLDSSGELPPGQLGPVTVADKPVDAAAVVTLVTSQLRRDMPAA